MPIFPAAIPELTTHIIDPIVQQSVNRLIDTMGYREIFKNNIDIRSDWSKTSSTSDANYNARLATNTFVAEVAVQMNPKNTRWSVMNFQHTLAYGISNNELYRNNPIFFDPDAHIRLFDQVSPCSIMLTCRMLFVDKSHSYQAASMLFNRWSSDAVTEQMDLFYDYPLPKEIQYVLYTLHNLKCKRFPSFFDYLKAGSDGQIAMVLPKDTNNVIERVNKQGEVVTEQRPTRVELVVKKTNLRCMSLLEYDDEAPQALPLNKRPKQYEIPFIFTVQFGLPNHVLATYPIVVDQQLVPETIIPIDSTTSKLGREGHFANRAQDAYRQMYLHQRKQCYKVPFHDDWFPPPSEPPSQYTQKAFYQALLLVDPTAEVTTIDLLGDLGAGAKLHPIVREILKLQGRQSFDLDAIFQIAAYRNTTYIDGASVSFIGDPDELVVAFPAKNIHTVYHLVISQPLDFLKVSKKLWPIAAKYKDFLGYTKAVDSNDIPTDPLDRGDNYGDSTVFRILLADILPCRPGQGAAK